MLEQGIKGIKMAKRYILLMRHGAVNHEDNKAENEQSLKDGGKDVKQVANRFAEVLTTQQKGDIILGKLWHGNYEHVHELGAFPEHDTYLDTLSLHQQLS